MPWQERSVMSERTEFCQLAHTGEVPIAELCRRFGIGRTTAYKWLARAEAGEPLADRSRRPQSSPTRTDPAMEAIVLALRDTHPTWGGRKLQRRLLDLDYAAVPAPSTITAILRRHDRLDPATAGQPRAWQRFEAAAPNDLWQLDFKGPVPLGTGPAHPLVLLDDQSRFLLGIEVLPDQREPTVRPVLTDRFRHYGLPWALLCDNGPPWGSVQAEAGLTTLSGWLLRLGITVLHGRPYHPQTQGKLERCNRTFGADVLATTRFPDVATCQSACDVWRTVYNTERPHEALGGATPLSRYTPSPRPFPETLPQLVYEPDDQVRKVQQTGHIAYQGRRVRISHALAGEFVAVRPTLVDGIVAVYYAHQRVRTLDLRQPPEVGL